MLFVDVFRWFDFIDTYVNVRMIICVCNLVVFHMLKDADTHPQYPFGDLVLTWYTFVLEAAVKTSTVTGLAALFF